MVFRGMAGVFSAWPLLLIVFVIVSPIGPHVLWEYSYRDFRDGYRVYYSCTYFGSRGPVDYMHGDDCPLIAIIDRRHVN